MRSIQITTHSPAIGFALLLAATATLSACSEPQPPQAPIAAPVDQQIEPRPEVAPKSSPEISNNSESHTGLYAYYADVATFTDCDGNGKPLPLHANAISLELERAYGQAGFQTAQPMLVEVIGQVEAQPGTEDGTLLPHMVASQLIRVSDKQACPEKESNALTGQWYLVAIADEAPAEGQLPHLTIDGKDKFHGRTGCNNLHGSYQLDGNSLTLSNVAVTKMACPDQDDQESAFLQALNKTTGFSLEDQMLVLTDKNGSNLLEFTQLDLQ